MTPELIIIAQCIIAFMVLISLISYHIGKKKGNKPIITGLCGFIFSAVPIVGLIYLIILFQKPDQEN